MSSKSVKLFNLEERKTTTGSITEVDIFQWKNTLIDNLRRDEDFKDHIKENARWETERVKNRGFQDVRENDGTAKKKADQVSSMLTKIASYAPKAIVREITKRTTCLSDVWSIAQEWAGIHSYGTKHLDYFKTKNSYLKEDADETPQEFFYRLRASMEDTLVQRSDGLQENGKPIIEDEELTPTIRSIIVMDWINAIGGPALVEHIHRVYAKDLETTTLAALQPRIWKNLTALTREIEDADENVKISRCKIPKEGKCGYVNSYQNRRPNQQRFVKNGKPGTVRQNNKKNNSFCKLCKASGSKNFRSHNIAECWLLSEEDRKAINNASAKANALFAYDEEKDTETEAETTVDENSDSDD